jgi:hypothetical protein
MASISKTEVATIHKKIILLSDDIQEIVATAQKLRSGAR